MEMLVICWLTLSHESTCGSRFVETGAFKAFRDTGRMQLPEFGTQVGKLRSLWLALMGMTGLGQGEARPLRHSQSELRTHDSHPTAKIGF